jgi:hypothetical protein
MNTGKLDGIQQKSFLKRKKKKWTIEQLDKLIPSTILKNLNRIFKQVKTLLVLKVTKKVISAREESRTSEYETESAHLNELKSIDHGFLGKYFARNSFPEEFQDQEEDKELPSKVLLDQIKSHPKFTKNLTELKDQIAVLQNERKELVEKQERILIANAKGVPKQKPDHTKTSAVRYSVFSDYYHSLLLNTLSITERSCSESNFLKQFRK